MTAHVNLKLPVKDKENGEGLGIINKTIDHRRVIINFGRDLLEGILNITVVLKEQSLFSYYPFWTPVRWPFLVSHHTGS